MSIVSMSSPRDAGVAPSSGRATAMIVCSSILVAGSPVLARGLLDNGASPVTVAWARYVVAAVLLGGLVRPLGPARRAVGWGLVSGAALGLGSIAHVEAVRTSDLALVGLVAMTAPIWTVVCCWAVFGRRPTRRSVAGVALVVVGAVCALGPAVGAGADAGIEPASFVAPIAFGCSVAVLTERLDVLDAPVRLAVVAVGASGVLTPIVLVAPGGPALPASFGPWLLVGAIGVVGALVPMSLYAVAAPRLGAARAAVAGSVELPAAFVLGVAVFGETLRTEQLIGGVLVVSAIVVASGRGRRVGPVRQAGSMPIADCARSSVAAATPRALSAPTRSRRASSPRSSISSR